MSDVVALILLILSATGTIGAADLKVSYLIWLLWSVAATCGAAGGAGALWVRKREREKVEEEMRGREVEKWKGLVKEKVREVQEVGKQAERLRSGLRIASKSRSVSRGRRGRGKEPEVVHVNETDEKEKDGAERHRTPTSEHAVTRAHESRRAETHATPSPRPQGSSARLSGAAATGVNELSTNDANVARGGHGERGSLQSDDNFLAVNALSSDAVSDTASVGELRRGRSRSRVEGWRERQLVEGDGDGTVGVRDVDDNEDAVGGGRKTYRRQSVRWIEEARRGFREWMAGKAGRKSRGGGGGDGYGEGDVEGRAGLGGEARVARRPSWWRVSWISGGRKAGSAGAGLGGEEGKGGAPAEPGREERDRSGDDGEEAVSASSETIVPVRGPTNNRVRAQGEAG